MTVWVKTGQLITQSNRCPPRVKQLFNLKNLKRLGVVYSVPKNANLIALDGFGIRVAAKLYQTSEAKKVYELYGMQYIPL